MFFVTATICNRNNASIKQAMTQFQSTSYLSSNALRTCKRELQAQTVIWTGARITVTASDLMHAGTAGQNHMVCDVITNVSAICWCNYSLNRETNNWELAVVLFP
jgi:hypothetical protein